MTAGADADAETVHIVIREENAEDAAGIEAVIRAAFHDHPYSVQTEHVIVRGLRESRALTLSLVATMQGEVIGHVALSPVTVDGLTANWWGLGPLSVMPSCQRMGVGSKLVRSALGRMREVGIGGCVVLGDPAYYRRFGFAPVRGLIYPKAPTEHFLSIVMLGDAPDGEVAYHPAFSVQP